MNAQTKSTEDPRIAVILELITKLTSGSLEARGTPSELANDPDRISLSANPT